MDFYDACILGNIDKAQELLKAGVNPAELRNIAIRIACCNGHVDIVKLLLQDERVDPADDSNFAIRYASCFDHVDVVELLLQDSRVDPTSHNNWALKVASRHNNFKVVEVLLQDGRVEVTNDVIDDAKTKEIQEMLIVYKYRVDGKEYCKLKSEILT